MIITYNQVRTGDSVSVSYPPWSSKYLGNNNRHLEEGIHLPGKFNGGVDPGINVDFVKSPMKNIYTRNIIRYN